LEGGSDEEEIVEVLASHYLDAYSLAPDAPDAAGIKENARLMLARAGDRAASLAALGEAERYFVQAAALSDEPGVEAELLERAGTAAKSTGNSDAAVAHLERAAELCREQNLTHLAARVSARLAEVMWDRGKVVEAIEDMDRAFKVLQGEQPDENLGWLAAQLGRFLYFAGHTEQALERIESAIDIAESFLFPEVLAHALTTKAIVLYSSKGRIHEGYALLKYALELALENDLPSAAMRAFYNLADLDSQSDQYRESPEHVEAGLALARRAGSQFWEWNFLGQLFGYYALGEVDPLLSTIEKTPRGNLPRYLEAHATRFRARFLAAKGDDAAVEQRFKSAAGMFTELAVPYWAAVVQLEHAEWLAERGRQN